MALLLRGLDFGDSPVGTPACNVGAAGYTYICKARRYAQQFKAGNIQGVG